MRGGAAACNRAPNRARLLWSRSPVTSSADDPALHACVLMEELMSKLAQAVYRPLGLGAGLAAGSIAGAIFKQVWKRVADEDEAPDALQSEYPMGKVILAAAIQGLIFGSIKALIERSGAHLFQRLTGSWPGH